MHKDWLDYNKSYPNIEAARKAFQEDCVTLYKKIYPNKAFDVKENVGDGGIDIFIGNIGVEPISVIQCKYFINSLGESQKQQIRKSFNTALNSKKFKLKNWTLCTPLVFDVDESIWWNKWKSTIEQKTKFKKDNILLENGSDLVDFFKQYSLYNLVFQKEDSLKLDAIKEKIDNLTIVNEINIVELLNNDLSNKKKDISNILIKKIESIETYLIELKIVTATNEINSLLGSEYLQYLTNKNIGDLYLLLAKCQELKNENSYQSYTKADEYLVDNYDVKAILGFNRLYEYKNEEALNIAEKILALNHNHILGSSLKSIIQYNSDIDIIKSKVPPILFTDLTFRYPIFIWHINNKSKKILEIADKLNFNEYENYDFENLTISHKNITFWTIFCKYIIHKYFVLYKDFDSKEGLLLKERISALLKTLTNALDKSEIREEYADIYFQFHYFIWLKDFNLTKVSELENAFHNIPLNLIDLADYMQLLEVACQLNDIEFYNKVELIFNKCVDELKNTAQYNFLLIRLYIAKNEYLKADEEIYKILTTYDIDDYIYLNLNVTFFLYIMKETTLSDRLNNHLENIDTTKNDFTFLTKIYHKTYFKKEKINELEELKLLEIVDLNNTQIELSIARIFYENESYKICKKLLEKDLNKTTITEQLVIYCDCLYWLTETKKELLDILKTLRDNDKFNVRLVQLELEYYYKLKRWDLVNEITLYGLKFLPNHRNYLFARIIALNNLELKDDVRELIENIDYNKYDDDFIENVAKAYHFLKDYSMSKKIGYELVQKSKKFEELFFNLNINIPQEEFDKKEFLVNGLDLIVEFEGRISEIKYENNEEIYSTLIGKKIGDSFEHKNNFNGKIKFGKIIFIGDKYDLLMYNIFNNVGNPTSKIKASLVEFDSSSTESFIESLKESFGEAEEIKNEKRASAFEEYYNRHISFYELKNQSGISTFFDLYQFLTKNEQNKFITLPISLIESQPKKTGKFLLDISSIFQFYYLDKINLLTTENEFYISSFTKNLLKEFFLEEKTKIKSEFTVNITKNDVIPTFYSAEFYETRKLEIKELENFIEAKLKISNSSSFVDWSIQLEDKFRDNDSFSAILDNALMCQEDFLLLTNDFIYLKYNLGSIGNICNPYYFFRDFEQNNFIKINNHLIENNYVGVELNLEKVVDEFNLFLKNSTNRYINCINNFEFQFNPNVKNTIVGVMFLKSILSLNDETIFIRECERVLIVMLSFNNAQYLQYLNICLNKIFLDDKKSLEIISVIAKRILSL